MKKTKYKVGDLVCIRPDLNTRIHCDVGVTDGMLEYAGRTAKIIRIPTYTKTYFKLNIDNEHYSWEDILVHPVDLPYKPTKTKTHVKKISKTTKSITLLSNFKPLKINQNE